MPLNKKESNGITIATEIKANKKLKNNLMRSGI